MSRNVKIVVGVLVGAFVLGGVALAIGGDDLMGRLRFRSVRQSVQESVKVKTPKVVVNKCPSVTELVYNSNGDPYPQTSSSVKDFFEVLAAETAGGKSTNCPYSLTIAERGESSDESTFYGVSCDPDSFNLKKDADKYSIECGGSYGSGHAYFTISAFKNGNSWDDERASIRVLFGTGSSGFRLSLSNKRDFHIYRGPEM